MEELYVVPNIEAWELVRNSLKKLKNTLRERSSAVFIIVLPQDRAAIEFWIHMGYKILNTIELAKDLEPAEEEDTRLLEFFGYPIHICKWRREDCNEREREYLETLENSTSLAVRVNFT